MKLFITIILIIFIASISFSQNTSRENTNKKNSNYNYESNSTKREKPGSKFIDQINSTESVNYQNGSAKDNLQNWSVINQSGNKNSASIEQENNLDEIIKHQGVFSSIYQEGNNNEAYIYMQAWWNTFGIITQVGYSNYALQNIGSNNLPVSSSGFSSFQKGDYNKSEQYMNGQESFNGINFNNFGIINQLGNINYGLQSMLNGQGASKNNAFLFSTGNSNQSFQYMKGSKNISEVHQNGEKNISKSIQN